MADEFHVEWLKEGVSRWNKRRKKVDFAPDLSGIRFFDHLPKDFRDQPKTSRYFEKLDLSGADLTHSDLSDLNFSRANFTGANLSNANLSKSNFRNATFKETSLIGADVSRSLFEGAIFEEVHIQGLDLANSEIEGAIFLATEISSSQMQAIEKQNARVYSARSDFQIVVSETSQFQTVAKPTTSDIKDERTKKTRYDVYYGTNRVPILERGALVGFNEERSNNISFGVCEVIIPENRPIGKLGTSLFKDLFNKKGSSLKIESTIPLDIDLFWSHLIRTSEKMKIKARPTVFVHGYNNSFENAVLRAAQIGGDLGIGQGIGLFSWPSQGKLANYSADESSADVSRYDLATFLEGYVENGSEMGINIIAHSMGCRVLLGAFEVLASKKSSILKEIHQVILAAADVDNRIMPHLGVHAIEHSERITSYASGIDKALKLSGWRHKFPRIGMTPPTYVIDGMDTIVVSDLDLSENAHSYIAGSRVILTDVFSILKNGLPPESRHGLEMATTGSLRYWKIRD